MTSTYTGFLKFTLFHFILLALQYHVYTIYIYIYIYIYIHANKHIKTDINLSQNITISLKYQQNFLNNCSSHKFFGT